MDIGTGTSPAAPERRQVRINGASASANSLGEWLSILWLTPAMDRLFLEGASGRRRFLDRLVLALAPGHALHAARYEAAMRARNKLLAEEGARDEAWLGALEARMAEHGAAIVEARRLAVAALTARLETAPEGPFARAALALEGGDEELAPRLPPAGSRRRRRADARRAAPHRPPRHPCRQAAAGGALLDRRAEGPAPRHHPRPCRPRRRARRAAADPAARRGRRPSRPPPPRGLVRAARGGRRPGLGHRHRALRCSRARGQLLARRGRRS